MTEYLLLILLWAFLAVVADAAFRLGVRGAHEAFTYGAGALLFALMALRATTVGTDVEGYRWQYETRHFRSEELGYSLLVALCNDLGFSFQQFLAVVSLIIVTSLVLLIRQLSSSPLLSFILYMTMGSLAMNMSGLRQSLAVAFTMFAFLAVIGGRHIYFLALTLVAVSFHNSAAVFLIVLLLARLRLTRASVAWIMAAIIAFLVIGHFADPPQVSLPFDRYDDYVTSTQSAPNPLTIIVAAMIPLVSLLLISAKSWTADHARSPTSAMPILLLMSLANFAVVAYSTEIYMSSRLSYYFLPYVAILIPNAIHSSRSLYAREFGPIIALAVGVSQFLIATPGGSLGIDQYAFYWERS